MNYMKFLRLSRCWSQSFLAKMLGIHEGTYSRIENGWLTRPPKGLDERLEAVFGKQWTFERLMQPVPDLTEPPAESTETRS
jgi:transcriptional regulator with XRE-family HTH domain